MGVTPPTWTPRYRPMALAEAIPGRYPIPRWAPRVAQAPKKSILRKFWRRSWFWRPFRRSSSKSRGNLRKTNFFVRIFFRKFFVNFFFNFFFQLFFLVHPNGSERVWTGPSTSANVEKLRENVENRAKIRETLVIIYLSHRVRSEVKSPMTLPENHQWSSLVTTDRPPWESPMAFLGNHQRRVWNDS